MKVLVFNQDWFVAEMRAAGHQVVSVGFVNHLDLVIPAACIHIDSVISQLEFGCPDIIVFFDNSAPIMLEGLDETDIRLVFFSVDIHHHFNFHRHLVKLFDFTFVAQRDYLLELRSIGGECEWMPLWAPRYCEPVEDKIYPAVFIGTMNPKLNSRRVQFFSELKERVPLTITTGAYWEYFTAANIVINQTVKGDLNFRVFEAMMCGAVLLTERAGNGLLEIFEEGKDLVTYSPDNVDEAAAMIKALLDDPQHCQSIAASGRAKILSAHTSQHRATRFIEVLEQCKKTNTTGRNFAATVNYTLAGAKFVQDAPGSAAKAFCAALRAAQKAAQVSEECTFEVACHIVFSAMHCDRLVGRNFGQCVLNEMCHHYEEDVVFKVMKLRGMLNIGHLEEARDFVAFAFGTEPEATFAVAEQFVANLMSSVVVL